MKYLLTIVLALSISGCTAITDKKKEEFEEKKQSLEREIEILRLTKRKLLLQNQLEDLEGK